MRNLLSGFPQILPQNFRRVDFGDDLGFKIRSRAVAQKFVVRARETIRAAVDAAAIAVDRKLETDVRRIVFRDYRFGRGFFKNL